MTDRVRAVLATFAVGLAAAGAYSVYFAEHLLYSLRENQPSVYDFSAYAEYRDAAGPPVGLGYAAVAALLVWGALMLRRRTAWWGAAAALAVVVSFALPVAVPAALPRVIYGEDPVFSLETTYPDPARSRQVACFEYEVEGRDRNPNSPTNPPELCVQVRSRAKPPRLLTDRPAELDPEVSRALADDLNESGLRPFDSPKDFRSDEVDVIRAEWANAPGESAGWPAPGRLTPRGAPRGDAGTGRLVLRAAAILDRCAGVPGGYAQCTEIDALRRAGIPIGADISEVEIMIIPRGYTIESVSTSGRSFTITANGRRRARTCAPAGRGTCRADGTW